MRFGIHLPNSGVITAQADLVAMAVRSEELGYDAVWVYDHIFNPVELSAETRKTRADYYNKADMPYYDALTTLAVVAGATQRIGLGTRILLPVLRPPTALAKQIATLAVLAGEGRLVIGVGAGWLIEEFDAVDVDHAERFARLDEHMGVMTAIWEQGITSHDGNFYSHAPAGFHPVPTEKIPVLIGGAGRGAIRRVAEWGDGWALPNIDPGPDAEAALTGLLGQLREACDTAGRDIASVRLVAGSPLDADPAHFDLLQRLGIDDVDLVIEDAADLNMAKAATFMERVAPQFS